ncbi:unnamed protein product [Spirodela intermedia]|uniref:Uncharacterized protein n=1 Tax=Spirodela intermedia TaxID=51605 RepID=A0A7I8JG81_SPIIN|nr:unnamed protein product [Spirodela intermedia]CAA6669168.1 unnamed protein product [Spirodela intermedia]
MAALKRLIPALNRVLVEKIVPRPRPPPVSSSQKRRPRYLPCSRIPLNSGKVVAVGPGVRHANGSLVNVAFKEGDLVLLPEYGGTEVKLGEKSKYHLYRDDDILGTLHE